MRILIVEDSEHFARLLRRVLEEEGNACDVAPTGEDALWMAASTDLDLMRVDVMLPGIDGVDTVRRMRQEGVRTPVLMLTARDAVPHRVAGLDAGADDYLTKPFALQELLARLRALARRGSVPLSPVLEVGSLLLDPQATEPSAATSRSSSTPRSSPFWRRLVRHPGELLSRLDLLGARLGLCLREPLQRHRRLRPGT